ncbi:MAG: hypothetical protein H6Q75_1545, partial [Firmicutes bacterium]|nr:hypothetical protein [Bacillota bacterium]
WIYHAARKSIGANKLLFISPNVYISSFNKGGEWEASGGKYKSSEDTAISTELRQAISPETKQGLFVLPITL